MLYRSQTVACTRRCHVAIHAIPVQQRRLTTLCQATRGHEPVWLHVRHPILKDLEDWSVLDCRCYAEYLEGHIPGAVHISWKKDCCRQTEGDDGRMELETDPDGYGPMLEKKGVSDKPVLVIPPPSCRVSSKHPTMSPPPLVMMQVYGARDELTVAQVWWALTVYGCDVRLLKGGYQAWCDQGCETELYEPCPLKLQSVFEASGRPWHVAGPRGDDDQEEGNAVVCVHEETVQVLQGLTLQDLVGRREGDKESLARLVNVLGLQLSKVSKGGVKAVFESADGGASACMAAALWSHAGGSAWMVRM